MIIQDRIQRRDCADAIFAIDREKRNLNISDFLFNFWEEYK